jgi:hypothetical protein
VQKAPLKAEVEVGDFKRSGENAPFRNLYVIKAQLIQIFTDLSAISWFKAAYQHGSISSDYRR